MIRISGYSDDVVSIDGDVSHELGAYNKARRITVGGLGGGICIVARYAPGKTGTWRLSVEPVDEGVSLPWPVRVVAADSPYSLAVEIDCPHGTPVFAGKKRLG